MNTHISKKRKKKVKNQPQAGKRYLQWNKTDIELASRLYKEQL